MIEIVTENGKTGERLTIDIDAPLFTSTVAEFTGQHPFAIARERVEARAAGARTFQAERWPE